MRYLTRHIEETLRESTTWSKVILLLGARQTGKSTVLKQIFPEYKHITFDPIIDIYGARAAPDLFLENIQAPLILDEIQYVPELFSALKRHVDKSEKTGQYILTGSQNILLMKQISDTLAGRVMIFHLHPFTLSEMTSRPQPINLLTKYLNNSPEYLSHCEEKAPSQTLVNTLWRGSMPGITDLPEKAISHYFRSYLNTYIERDVRSLASLRDHTEFGRFVQLIAALSSHEINYSQLGREIGITPKTSKFWLSLLKNTYQFAELLPWKGNAIKRISGKSKGYISDSGLLCYLQHISTPQALLGHPMYGRIFETWVITKLIALCDLLPGRPGLYHWRTNGGAEVDLVLEYNGKVFPVEIKGKNHISKHDTSGLKAFFETYKIAGQGMIIYSGRENYTLDNNISVISWLNF